MFQKILIFVRFDIQNIDFENNGTLTVFRGNTMISGNGIHSGSFNPISTLTFAGTNTLASQRYLYIENSLSLPC